MKIVNYMNFVRFYEPRTEDQQGSVAKMYNCTKREIEIAKEYNIDSTFLLQYDALIDENYIDLFKSNVDEHMEIGLWFEVVRPLTDKVGLKWRGNPQWGWDWKIVPGFLMAYSTDERELLVDEAMNRFKEIYGYYPKTVASWLIDTHSVNYLSQKYNVSMVAICRDQVCTDAYTLVGGYFNQAYYPSKNNMFTPAKSDDMRIKTPVFRLLGPDPVHNYDSKKYILKNTESVGSCFTLEPVHHTGSEPEIVDWFFKTYFKNENLGFSYAQIGQENSFFIERGDFTDKLCMQIEKLLSYDDVNFMTMSATGDWFKKTYTKTPATCVVATDDWDSGKREQSVYYNCQNYTANVFRIDNRIFLRSLYKFDENIKDAYKTEPCTTWDATYENMPIVDTVIWDDDRGFTLDDDGCEFNVEKYGDAGLAIKWKNKQIIMTEGKITFVNIGVNFNTKGSKADISVIENCIEYLYNGNKYSVIFENATITENNEILSIVPYENEMSLII